MKRKSANAIRTPRPFGPSGLSRLAFGAASLLGAFVLTGSAAAREVTVTVTASKNFIGGIYAILYITDADRTEYRETLWAAGRNPSYVGELPHWWRATDDIADVRHEEYDGKSSASMHRGEVLSLSVDIADELFDAGYVIRADSSLYGGRTYPSDAVIPLSTNEDSATAEGRGYIRSLKVEM